MGVVYRAREVSTDREVALKWLPRSGSALDARFEREARAAAAVRHPGIVTVHTAGETPDGRFIVMELIEGFALSDAIENRRLGERVVLGILAQTARALEAAHALSIIHRDVKPENILVDLAGNARLADFGLARFADQASTLTRSGVPLGTTAYMAPEVLSEGGGAATPASDVFSLGCILYEILSGSPPFGEGLEPLTRTRSGRRDPLPAGVPWELRELCDAALSLDPAGRPTARAFAERLEVSSGRPHDRRRLLFLVGLVLPAALGIAFALVSSNAHPADPSSQDAADRPSSTLVSSSVVTGGDAALQDLADGMRLAAAHDDRPEVRKLATAVLANPPPADVRREALLALGRIALLDGDSDRAENCYREVLVSTPTDAAALFGLFGAELEKDGRYLKAYGDMKASAKDTPEMRACAAIISVAHRSENAERNLRRAREEIDAEKGGSIDARLFDALVATAKATRKRS
jgi:hypothetical protein